MNNKSYDDITDEIIESIKYIYPDADPIVILNQIYQLINNRHENIIDLINEIIDEINDKIIKDKLSYDKIENIDKLIL